MTFKISWRVFSVGKRDLSILTIMDNFIDVQVVHLRVFKRLLNLYLWNWNCTVEVDVSALVLFF